MYIVCKIVKNTETNSDYNLLALTLKVSFVISRFSDKSQLVLSFVKKNKVSLKLHNSIR